MRVCQVPEIVLLQASLIAQPIATNTMTCRVQADQNSSIITVNVEDGMMQSASLKSYGAWGSVLELSLAQGEVVGHVSTPDDA